MHHIPSLSFDLEGLDCPPPKNAFTRYINDFHKPYLNQKLSYLSDFRVGLCISVRELVRELK